MHSCIVKWTVKYKGKAALTCTGRQSFLERRGDRGRSGGAVGRRAGAVCGTWVQLSARPYAVFTGRAL